MLDDSSSEQCLMREKKEDGGLMFMCSCTGEECNDMLIFPSGTFDNLRCIPRLSLASNINCVIAMEFGIAFCGEKLLVAGAILVSSESCQTSTFLFCVQRIFLRASLSSSFWSKSDIQLETLHLKVDEKKDESKMFRAVLLTYQNTTYANYIIKHNQEANAIFKVLPLLKGCFAIVWHLFTQIQLSNLIGCEFKISFFVVTDHLHLFCGGCAVATGLLH